MIGFRRHRRGSDGLPSTTGLILLFVFTMALPAILLLLLSLVLAREDDLGFEITMNRILMGRAQEFQAQLDSATRDWLKPYLETDWSSWMDSPRELSNWVESEQAELFLYGLDGTLLYPLFPPSPDRALSPSDRTGEAGWRQALQRARSFAEGGEFARAMQGFEELRRFPLGTAQRVEALLEEIQVLSREGKKKGFFSRSCG